MFESIALTISKQLEVNIVFSELLSIHTPLTHYFTSCVSALQDL